MSRSFYFYGLLTFLLSLASGCGYRDFKTFEFSESAGELSAATFSVINRRIIQPKCASCHEHEAGSEEALDSYTAVRAMVEPGNPKESELYEEVENGAMPVLMPSLSDDEVLAIYKWIEKGAPND